ncbi:MULTISPECIES: DUF4381 domain-containing protein [Pseudomonas]|uniref:DUF4381 domain-containing protein n=1 Tax=Pseudomonas nitroreducens TaxID=46680 RepID=UPI001E30582E|nr:MULTISPECIES: DUF4381 domain-containing protein [Pseudomonas]MCE4070860.1 DUF4381 domain-containing protein [Pseudomonas nitritireducens]MCE4080270.1 DUF4381 domain-containing protein [Pseudomonas nitroreducens]
MSTPRIDQLQELPAPPTLVSYWPQTWAWAVLALLLVAALAVWALWRYRRWRRDRYRREALLLLDDLGTALADPQRRLAALRQLPSLLKRVALSMPGGEATAALGGSAWRSYLQGRSPAQLPDDLDQRLAMLAYAPDARVQALDEQETQALLAVCREWIEVHHVAV